MAEGPDEAGDGALGVGKDHAEGLSLMTEAPLSVLVCYDSPDKPRIEGADGSAVKADIFEIAG